MDVSFVQIEITTVCNFRCFYCAGRDMPQKHMPLARFEEILARLTPSVKRVSLQGEGEPTAHPEFWAMAERVRRARRVPFTITNGSLLDVGRAAGLFPVIGVSLDTLDPAEARRVGRFKLARVLSNVEALIAAMGAARVIVHSVDYGQDLRPLRAYLKAHGPVRHVVQPLQAKDDYRRRYPDRVPAVPQRPGAAACRFLDGGWMRYYTIDGVELPCCYIKDTARFRSIGRLKSVLASGQVPAACGGCRELARGAA